MKKRISLTIVFFIIMGLKVFCQTEKQYLVNDKYTINYAFIDSVDVTTNYVLQGSFITFFLMEDYEGILFMAIVCPNSESMSVGAIEFIDLNKFDESEEYCAIDYYKFHWHYINTYDEERGVAMVRFLVFYHSHETLFAIEIIPEEKQQRLFYKGFLEN